MTMDNRLQQIREQGIAAAPWAVIGMAGQAPAWQMKTAGHAEATWWHVAETTLLRTRAGRIGIFPQNRLSVR